MVVATKRKNINRKLSPDTGKVSTARLTKGVSVSRHKKAVFTERYYILACHSRTVVKRGREYNNKKVRGRVKNPA